MVSPTDYRTTEQLVDSLAAFNNNLRTRSLLSFIAVVIQIPAGWALQFILDYPGWGRRKRGLVGLTGVCIPLVIAWVWEMVRPIVPLLQNIDLRFQDPYPKLRPQQPTT
jgi:hypothetical protein